MRIFILLIFLLTINIPNIYSQNSLIEILKNEGLQNIQYHEDENDIYLSYENNRYRFEAEAMAFVLKALSNSFELTNKEVSILIKNKGIAMSLLKTSLENLRLLNTKEISFEVIEDSFEIKNFIFPSLENQRMLLGLFSIYIVKSLGV